MQAWWDSLSGLQHFFYYVAFPSTLILIVQTILTFMGGIELGDMDLDVSLDVELEGGFDLEEAGAADLKLLSFRGIVAFFTLFGWVGVLLLEKKVPVLVVFVVAFLSGATAMYVIAWIFKQMYKLQEAGNIDLRNAEGKIAQVYLRIPKERTGTGKIQVLVQERYIEVDAVTDDEDDIATGQQVYVIMNLEENKVLVERKIS